MRTIYSGEEHKVTCDGKAHMVRPAEGSPWRIGPCDCKGSWESFGLCPISRRPVEECSACQTFYSLVTPELRERVERGGKA